MRLEDVSAEIRPRTAWEAIDLGMALVRRDYGFILLAWMCTVLPFCALLLALLYPWPGMWVLAIFWFKPLFDRVPLFIISRSLFGTRPTLREIFGSPKFFTKMLLGDLTWRRFSLSRSYVLPVGLLEGLSGKKRAVRVGVLNREADAHNSSLVTACAFFEVSLIISLIVLGGVLNPMQSASIEIQDWVSGFGSEDFLPIPMIVYVVFTAVYFLAVSLVEPFYVGAGFGMYVNGRTRSEGWDLELAFRQMEARLGNRASKVASGLLLGWLLVSSSTPSYGQDVVFDLEAELTTEERVDSTDSVIDGILEEPEFEVYSRTETRWERKGESDDSSTSRNLGSAGFQAFGEILFWIVVVASVIGLAYWIYTYRHVFQGHGLKKRSARLQPRATTVMGMDVRAESLPDNITQAAWDAWSAGRKQEALSLLYRGSISWMVEREHLPIIESDTEADCLTRADALSNRQMLAYFKDLTDRWTSAAYGKLWPDDETVKGLCQEWPFRNEEVTS